MMLMPDKRLVISSKKFRGDSSVVSVRLPNELIKHLKVTKTARKSFWYSGWRKYKVEITMKDRYDFLHLAKEDSGTIPRVINNIFGYYPQEWNLLKPYWWTFSCSYTCNI